MHASVHVCIHARSQVPARPPAKHVILPTLPCFPGLRSAPRVFPVPFSAEQGTYRGSRRSAHAPVSALSKVPSRPLHTLPLKPASPIQLPFRAERSRASPPLLAQVSPGVAIHLQQLHRERRSSQLCAITIQPTTITMSERGQFRGGRGGGRGRGGGGGGGRGGAGASQQAEARPKKENILDLNKYMDKDIMVKFSGGREGASATVAPLSAIHTRFLTSTIDTRLTLSSLVVTGTLKGYDQLMNLVLDNVKEITRGIAFYRRPCLCRSQS